MGVNNSANRKERTADGIATEFDFDFLIFQASDLLVYEVERDVEGMTISAELKELGTDYEVTVNSTTEGGTVTTLYVPADGKIILMIGEVPVTQGTEFPIGTGFSEVKIRIALDKLTRLISQLDDRLALTIQLPIYSGEDEVVTIEGLQEASAEAIAAAASATASAASADADRIAAQAAQTAAEAAAASIISVFPGFIGMYSGTLASIPSGWHLCDGTTGTPNLLGKMIPCVAAATNPGAVTGDDYVMPHTHIADSHNHNLIHKDGADARLQTTGDGVTESDTSYIEDAVVTIQSKGTATAYALAYIMKL
jgi:hypothetical protein